MNICEDPIDSARAPAVKIALCVSRRIDCVAVSDLALNDCESRLRSDRPRWKPTPVLATYASKRGRARCRAIGLADTRFGSHQDLPSPVTHYRHGSQVDSYSPQYIHTCTARPPLLFARIIASVSLAHFGVTSGKIAYCEKHVCACMRLIREQGGSRPGTRKSCAIWFHEG